MSISGLSASLLASAKAFCRGSILIAMSVYPDCSAFADFFKSRAKPHHNQDKGGSQPSWVYFAKSRHKACPLTAGDHCTTQNKIDKTLGDHCTTPTGLHMDFQIDLDPT